MQKFYDSLTGLTQKIDAGEYFAALIQVDEAFKTLLYDESDEQIFIDDPMLKAWIESFKVIEKILLLPEIEATEYIDKVITQTQNTIEGFLMNQVNSEDFWSQMVELAQMIHYLSGVGKYLEEQNLSLGSNENPDITIVLGEGGAIELYGRLAGNEEEEGLSMEKASDLQKEFLEILAGENTTATQMINLGSRLLSNQKFTEAIKTFEATMVRFPQETANCLNAIGACYYYLNEYERAIDYYLRALDAGEKEELVDYNVWECCTALVKNSTDRNQQMKWKFFYEEHFPNGKQKIEL